MFIPNIFFWILPQWPRRRAGRPAYSKKCVCDWNWIKREREREREREGGREMFIIIRVKGFCSGDGSRWLLLFDCSKPLPGSNRVISHSLSLSLYLSTMVMTLFLTLSLSQMHIQKSLQLTNFMHSPFSLSSTHRQISPYTVSLMYTCKKCFSSLRSHFI